MGQPGLAVEHRAVVGLEAVILGVASQRGRANPVHVDHSLGGHAGFELLDLLLDVIDDLQRIGAVPRYHHAAGRLGAVLVQRAAPQGRAQRHVRHLPDRHRHVGVDLDDAVLDILHRLDEADAANEILNAVYLDAAGAHVQVRALDGCVHLRQRHAVGAHGVRVHVHLVLADVSADRGDLAYPVGRLNRVADGPLLDRAKLLEVPSAGRVAVRIPAFERVPEYLPKGRGVRAKRRLDPFRQHVSRQRIELLQHPAAGPVEVSPVLEDDVDTGEPEHREASDSLYIRHAHQRYRQRVRHLVLDVLRASAHPRGKDNLLVLADVGYGVRGDGVARQILDSQVERRDVKPRPNDEEHQEHHHQLVAHAEAHQPAHRRSLLGRLDGVVLGHGLCSAGAEAGGSSSGRRMTSSTLPHRSMLAPK